MYEPFEGEDEIQYHVNIKGEPMILRSIEPKDEKEIVTEYQKWKGNRLPNKVKVKPVAAGKNCIKISKPNIFSLLRIQLPDYEEEE